jgi:hypothetical protein
MKVCEIPDCDNRVYSLKICRKHYFWKKHGNVNEPPVCSINGCIKLAVTRGWCSLHYGRWQKHNDPEMLGYETRADYCKVDGCNRTVYAKGYCSMHYTRSRERENIGGPEKLQNKNGRNVKLVIVMKCQ